MAFQELQSTSLVTSLATPFRLDRRSLAVMRIWMGIMLVLDTIFRWPTLHALCTDAGVLSRQAAAQDATNLFGQDAPFIWSLNFLSGELWLQQYLAIAMFVFAIFLITGTFTRIATLGCWVLLVSVHARNPLILSSGDTFLKLALFWSLFIPLGKSWSVDRYWKRNQPQDENEDSMVFTVGTVGLISQMIFMYFFAGIAKCNDYWFQGDAMAFILNFDIYARPWTKSLLDFPLLLKLVSWGTLAAEVVLVLLLLVPIRNSWWRTINIIVFFSLHLSIAATMELALFPYVCLIGWIALLPSGFWNTWPWNLFQPRWTSNPGNVATLGSSVSRRNWSGGLTLIGNGFGSFMLLYILLWNIGNLGDTHDGDLQQRLKLSDEEFRERTAYRYAMNLVIPKPFRWIAFTTGTTQHFQMFGVPPMKNPWFVYDATLANGKHIDLRQLKPVRMERPDSILLNSPGHHWRKYHRSLLLRCHQPLRAPLAKYHVRQWNQDKRPDKQVQRMVVLCFCESTDPEPSDEPAPRYIWYDSLSEKVESLDDLENLLKANANGFPGF